MKSWFSLIVWLFCVNALFAQTKDEFSVENQLIVQLKNSIEEVDVAFPKTAYIKEVLSQNMHIYLLESKTDFTDIDITFLKKQTAVHKVQYNHSVKSRSIVPNDPFFSLLWNLDNNGSNGGIVGADIQALDAWMLQSNITTALGDTIVIAIIEDPMDVYHEDINYFINRNEIDSNGIDDDGNGYIDDHRGWNAYDNNGNPHNTFIGHGIHVAGIAAAIRDNGIGVAGVASGFKVMPIAGSSEVEATVIKAYDYVINMRRLYDATSGAKGAFIVATNASFGVGNFGARPSNYPIWCAIYDTLGKIGILSAVSPPNANVNVDVVSDVPSACPSDFMVSVTSSTRSDNKTNGAAYGIETIDIGAPGLAIFSTYPNNQYNFLGGTSMAAPHVTGAMAAMFAVACPDLLNNYTSYPDSFALVFKKYLLDGAERTNGMNNRTLTNGRLNLYRAFLKVHSYNCNQCTFSYATAFTPIKCYGTTTGSIAINGVGLSYLWSTGDTTAALNQLSKGNYTVTISDGTCSQQEVFFFDEPQPINLIAVNILPITATASGNIIVAASAGNDSLMYAIDNGPYQITSAFATQAAGQYTLHIKNQYGCIRDTVVSIGFANGIDEENLSVAVYPNPASDKLTLYFADAQNESYQIQIFDMKGALVNTHVIQLKNGEQLAISNLSNGLYVLKIEDEQGRTITKKISVLR